MMLTVEITVEAYEALKAAGIGSEGWIHPTSPTPGHICVDLDNEVIFALEGHSGTLSEAILRLLQIANN